MKIRNGFVSNSSSSSFVIAYNEKHKCSHCGKGPVQYLKNIIQEKESINYSCDGTKIICSGANEIEDFFRKNFWYDSEEIDVNDQEKLIGAKELEAKGYTILFIQVSYEDHIIVEMIRNDTDIIIISKW